MELHLALDAHAGPLRLRVEQALRHAIADGRLPVGARLPASRQLARDLGVSRGVVVEAYAQLTAEGHLRGARGAGTHVAAGPPRPQRRARDDRPAVPPVRFDLDPTIPAVDGFPRAAWHAALGRVLRTAADTELGYGDPRGHPGLRAALGESLGRRRGLRVEPSSVIVTGGVRRGLPLVWSLLVAGGARRVGVETPGWPRVTQTAQRAGLEAVALPVDGQGLVAEAVSEARVDAVVVTPAHQFPTGAVLSPGRRGELVAWARESGGILVEDDFDAEYRYDKAPVGALQGLAPDVVAHLGSASKLLAPALALGWLVLPPVLAGRLPADRPDAEPTWMDPGAPSTLDQLAYADLLGRGELDRHLRRQRRRYAARRSALLAALDDVLPDLEVRGAAAGLFVVLRLAPGTDEDEVVGRALEAGLRLEGVGATEPALAVGYATLPESAARAAVLALRDVVEGLRAR